MSRAGNRDHRSWRAALVVLGVLGLATTVVRRPGFWSGYVLDMAGPAWNYILVRGLFSREQPAMLSRVLGPEAALALVGGMCVIIETMQFFELYEAHFDPLDFVAYFSLLVPCYVADRLSTRRRDTA